MIIEGDNNLENSDWIKTSTWDLPYENLEQYLRNYAPGDQREAVRHLMSLPAFKAAPALFRIEAETFVNTPALKFVAGAFIAKFDEDQPRDEAGRFSSDGGGSSAEAVSDVQAAVSLRMYTAYGHDIINNSLRGTRDDEAVREETQRSIAGLDHLINNYPTLEEPMTLYRGVAGAIAADFQSLQPGDTFTDKGYTSTTSEKYVADKFGSDAGRFGDVPYVNIVIEAPAGSKAFDVDTYVNERYISGTGRYENGLTPRGESEFILPRDATFEVTKNEGNNLYVRLVNG